jgi:uncharacterized DUF497 family protein
VSFDEAKAVFADPPHGRLLVVANLYFYSNGQEVIRIISAREASQNERKHYERI